MELAVPLGTPLGLAQRKRASPRFHSRERDLKQGGLVEQEKQVVLSTGDNFGNDRAVKPVVGMRVGSRGGEGRVRTKEARHPQHSAVGAGVWL